MDIHKNNVGHAIAAYPLDRIHHRIDHRQNLNRRIYFPQKGFQMVAAAVSSSIISAFIKLYLICLFFLTIEPPVHIMQVDQLLDQILRNIKIVVR